MTEAATPETDANEQALRGWQLDYPAGKGNPGLVKGDFARTLERQRDAALARVAELERILNGWKVQLAAQDKSNDPPYPY